MCPARRLLLSALMAFATPVGARESDATASRRPSEAGQGPTELQAFARPNAAFLPPRSLAVPATAWGDCRQMQDPDRGIAGCTVIVRNENLSVRSRAIAFNNRCAGYQLKGDLDRAVADCDQAIRLDPTNAAAFYNRGRAERKRGNLDRAIADYSEAIRLDPTSARAFANRGDAYAEKGDADRAIADFDQAIRVNPRFAKGFYNRGVIHAGRGDLDRAIADYTEAIRLDPNLARAFNSRGNAHLRKRDLDRAVADYAQALRLDPDFATARRNLEHARAALAGRSDDRSTAALEDNPAPSVDEAPMVAPASDRNPRTAPTRPAR